MQCVNHNQKQGNRFYNKEFGEGILKGRILVINASQTDIGSTAWHKYQHFLFAQATDAIEVVPEVSPRKIKEKRLRFTKGSLRRDLCFSRWFTSGHGVVASFESASFYVRPYH